MMSKQVCWCPFCAIELIPDNDFFKDPATTWRCPKCGFAGSVLDNRILVPPDDKVFRCPRCNYAHHFDLVSVFGPPPDIYCPVCGLNLTYPDKPSKKVTPLKPNGAPAPTKIPQTSQERRTRSGTKFTPAINVPSSPQSYQLSDEFPKAQIKTGGNKGLRLSYLGQLAGKWYMLMSSIFDKGAQNYHYGGDFPKDYIQRYWDQNYAITNLTCAVNGLWAVVMSQNSGYFNQTWMTRERFPVEEIRQGWDENKLLTDVCYGQGVWGIVQSEVEGYYGQLYFSSQDFPIKDIEEKFDEGYAVTSLAFGNGVWLVVMTKDTEIERQFVEVNPDFPNATIKKYWDKGFTLSQIAHGNGRWAVILSK